MRSTAEYPIEIGREFITYPKFHRVLGVELKGTRQRHSRLRRIVLETLRKFTGGMRGIPQFYAVDRVAHRVYLWPQGNYPMALLVDMCETNDEYKEETPIDQQRTEGPETIKNLQDCNVQGLT